MKYADLVLVTALLQMLLEQSPLLLGQRVKTAHKIAVNQDKVFGGAVPMVRCFWHAREGKSLATEPALNLACEYKNIYMSPIFGEGWEQAAKHMTGG